MPLGATDRSRVDFSDSVTAMIAFVAEARRYHRELASGHLLHIGARRVEDLAGLALLRIHLAWETFLEDSFVRYLCGGRTLGGYRPTLLVPREPTLASSLSTLLGTWDYLSWTARATLNRASTCFDQGEPFATAIGSTRVVIDEVGVVRNRVAHRSRHAQEQFEQVVSGRLGYVPRGMTAGRFLLTPETYPRQGGLPLIEVYANALIGAASDIVP